MLPAPLKRLREATARHCSLTTKLKLTGLHTHPFIHPDRPQSPPILGFAATKMQTLFTHRPLTYRLHLQQHTLPPVVSLLLQTPPMVQRGVCVATRVGREGWKCQTSPVLSWLHLTPGAPLHSDHYFLSWLLCCKSLCLLFLCFITIIIITPVHLPLLISIPLLQ